MFPKIFSNYSKCSPTFFLNFDEFSLIFHKPSSNFFPNFHKFYRNFTFFILWKINSEFLSALQKIPQIFFYLHQFSSKFQLFCLIRFRLFASQILLSSFSTRRARSVERSLDSIARKAATVPSSLSTDARAIFINYEVFSQASPLSAHSQILIPILRIFGN